MGLSTLKKGKKEFLPFQKMSYHNFFVVLKNDLKIIVRSFVKTFHAPKSGATLRTKKEPYPCHDFLAPKLLKEYYVRGMAQYCVPPCNSLSISAP
jgi:hypothetical protein